MIGFGTMGSGITEVFAMNGFEVNVYDMYRDVIPKSLKALGGA